MHGQSPQGLAASVGGITPAYRHPLNAQRSLWTSDCAGHRSHRGDQDASPSRGSQSAWGGREVTGTVMGETRGGEIKRVKAPTQEQPCNPCQEMKHSLGNCQQ